MNLLMIFSAWDSSIISVTITDILWWGIESSGVKYKAENSSWHVQEHSHPLQHPHVSTPLTLWNAGVVTTKQREAQAQVCM